MPGVIRVICPPFVCLAAVRDALAEQRPGRRASAPRTSITSWQGAYTGEISAPMLAGLATWVIVGHSERRRDAGETDELIGRKLARAVDAGLRPILCVGEQLAEREAGTPGGRRPTAARRARSPADDPARAARPPGWSSPTSRSGRSAPAGTPAARTPRRWPTRSAPRSAAGLGAAAADDVPVLYGGSVTSANIGEFLAEPSIDGALVGGASLKPDEMAGIVARAGADRRGAAGAAA